MRYLTSLILRYHFASRYSLQAAWGFVVLVFISLFAIGFLNSVSLFTSPVGWEKEMPLTPTGYSVKDYTYAARGKFAVMVYEAERMGDDGIYAQVSIDGAVKFREPVVLSSVKKTVAAKAPRSPSVAISREGVCFTAWQEYDNVSSRFIIRFSMSSDFGAGWSTPETIDLGTDISLIPRIFIDDKNRVHLFYHGFLNETFNLFHAIKEDGKPFEKPESVTRLPREMRGAFFPSIVVNGRYVFVAWQGKELSANRLSDDIYFMRSGNYGTSFSSPDRITRSDSSDASPYLYYYNGVLYCAYESNEKKSWDIRLIRSSDMGSRWDNVPVVITSTNANCYMPSAAGISSDELALFWYDNREGVNKVYTRRYGIADDRLSKELSVSDSKEPVNRPQGVSLGKKLLVMWIQGNRIRGKFSDSQVDTPVVFSKTHIEGKWTKSPDAVVEWTAPKDESGIAGFATLISRDPDTAPTIQNLSSGTRKETIPALEDGITYYHIRSIDGAGNYSRTVHFPLRVSNTPLAMPVIESKTHPELKAVDSATPVLTWQIASPERVKGFMISLSPDAPAKPDKYTEKMTFSSMPLPNGRYFFNVRGIDKTNTPGRISSYEFIVGAAESIDPSKYKGYGADIEQPTEPVRRIIPPVILTVLEPKSGFVVEGNTLSIRVKAVARAGYSADRVLYLIKQNSKLIKSGAFKGELFTIKNLSSGSYTAELKVRYTYIKGQEILTAESKPVAVNFSVMIPSPDYPAWLAEVLLSVKVASKINILLLLLFGISFALLFKSNRRLIYTATGIVERVIIRIRLIFARE